MKNDIQLRAKQKRLIKMGEKCSICGWGDTSCDLHHIIPKSKGGTDEDDNLVYICPNCHRLCHYSDRFSVEYLKSISLAVLHDDWSDFFKRNKKKQQK